MPGESIPPEQLSAGNDLPTQGPETASPPEPSQPAGPSPGAPPAGANQTIGPEPAEGGGLAETRGASAPADVDAETPPSPPGTPLDPAAVTGPPWRRLVAVEGTYTPPRLIRWPIVVGIVLFAGWIAAAALGAVFASTPSSTGAYVLTAGDAHFMATFPHKPQRTAKTVGTVTVIAYEADLSDHAVGVGFVSVPAGGPVSLDRFINGAAASKPGRQVVSRRSLTYQGQPAEDAIISSSALLTRMRVVRFGSSLYLLEGGGATASSFAHDYNVLLDSFTPLYP